MWAELTQGALPRAALECRRIARARSFGFQRGGIMREIDVTTTWDPHVWHCDADGCDAESSPTHEWWQSWTGAGLTHWCPLHRPGSGSGASLTPAKPRQAASGAAKGPRAADGRSGPLASKSLFDAD
jgi:hypothetical protein